VIALLGTWMVDHVGRKKMALLSSGLLTIFMFLSGVMTKIYGRSTNTAGIYSTIGIIFLFQGSYSVGWTPLTMLYPPEVLSFRMRSLGMGIYGLTTNLCGLLVVYVFPIALEAIGWKIYMITGTRDVFQFLFVLVFWVETKGKTLEQIDEVLDGEQVIGDLDKFISNVPDTNKKGDGKGFKEQTASV
jgi:MFS family permease